MIPDQNWSDHPFVNDTNAALGPSWVGDIVNTIGNSYTASNHACDYWGTSGSTTSGVVQPTAIIVTWDDWGGFYDHVPPYEVLLGKNNGTKYNPQWSCPPPATNSWGCGYTYGFRVPLLVVSEYTGVQSNGSYTGYVSGACGRGQIVSTCPNNNAPYVHDFGSILAFTEFNFGLKSVDQSGLNGYPDYNALDWNSRHTNTPLADFFSLYTGSGSKGRPFVKIPVVKPPDFFQTYYASGNNPTGPDTD